MSKTNSGKRRILLYSQDGYGLGHLRRNLNISEQLQKRCPGIEILMIVDSPVAPFFQLPPNCDFIKLPTLVKINSGIWRPYCLSMSCRDVLDLRTQMLEEIVLKFRPHLFLVDHMPHGVLGELRKPLRALKRHRPEAKIILGLRDILDAPQVVTHTWQKEGAFEAVEEFYDNIYIYGCKTVFATDAVYEFPQAVRSKARYCGYVAREASLERRRRNAPNPAAKDGKTVLVTGGADAGNFMELFLNAVRMLPPKIRFHAVLATGPFIGKIQKEKLQKKAVNLPVQFVSGRQDIIDELHRADLVLSMAGYNTVSEIMRFQKSAIVIPRPGPSAEQSMRSDIFSKHGWLDAIHPQNLCATGLAELVAKKLNSKSGLAMLPTPNLTGAETVSSFLLEEMQNVSIQAGAIL